MVIIEDSWAAAMTPIMRPIESSACLSTVVKSSDHIVAGGELAACPCHLVLLALFLMAASCAARALLAVPV
jgi:hypothetical protein